jgi:N-formylmaleamate deformylase
MKQIFLLRLVLTSLAIGLTPATRANAIVAPGLVPLQVTVEGNGPPMLLIPGYLCPGEVWAETVRHYSDRYRCHVVTLPGFAGAPALANGPYLPKFRDELIVYLRGHVKEPVVVVGHSMGGFLALWLAIAAPELVERVVVVDGLPFLPAAFDPGAKPFLDEASARRYEAMLKQFSTAQGRAQKEASLAPMISDSARRTRIASLAAASDPATEAWAMAELMATDLRADLAQLKRPLAVFGAFQAGGAPGVGAEIERRYRSQFAAAPDCALHMIEARHFLMDEQPAWLWSGIDDFLKTGHGAN